MKSQRSDAAVLLTTFLLTVIFDLTIAIQIGLLLAVVLFLRRISAVSNVSVLEDTVDEEGNVEFGLEAEGLTIPDGVSVYEIEGPFFFGVANKFEETIKQVGGSPQIRIIRMRKVPFMDSTGANNLRNLIKMSHKDKTKILLSGVNESVREVLKRSGIDELIGDEKICSNIHEAIEKSIQILADSK